MKLKLLLFIVIVCIAKNTFSQRIGRPTIKVIVFEYNEDNESDTSIFYVADKRQVTFELLNEHLYKNVRIPDSIRNESHTMDTVVIKTNTDNKNQQRTITMLYNQEGYLTEYFNSSCLACGNEPSRSYYIYQGNHIVEMILDYLGGGSRQIYEVCYDSENAINQIVIYKEYDTKNMNRFSNGYAMPGYSNDLEYANREIKTRILIEYVNN